MLLVMLVPLLLGANRGAYMQNAVKKVAIVFLYFFLLLLFLIGGIKRSLLLG